MLEDRWQLIDADLIDFLPLCFDGLLQLDGLFFLGLLEGVLHEVLKIRDEELVLGIHSSG